MDEPDDFEEYWRDLRAGRPKYEPPPPPPPPPPVPTLWLGVLDAGGREPTFTNYERQAFTPEVKNISFPQITGSGPFTVVAVAWFREPKGGQALFAMDNANRLTLTTGDTFSLAPPRLRVDLGAERFLAEHLGELGVEGLVRLFRDRGR